MSVTFWIPDAPTREEPCPYCLEVRDGDNDWGYTHRDRRVTCDRYCSGTIRVSEGPELNVANATARAMLEALGLVVEDLCGRIPAEVSAFLQRTMRATNTEACERAAVDGFEDRGEGGCRIISAGIDADRIRDRIGRLQDVLVYAAQHGYDVHYG